jgi:hypothetical protein
MKFIIPLRILLALLLFGAMSACGPQVDDDDDSSGDDDDDSTDDDDDDDDSADDDDDDDSADDDDDSADDDDDSADDDDDDSIDDDDDSSPPVASCDDPSLEAALQTLGAWGSQFSCSYSLFTSTQPDNFRLAASFNPPSSPGPTVGANWTQSFGSTASSTDVPGIFEVQTGTSLSHYDCNDAIVPGMEPVVAQQWNPISGVATMSVTALNGVAWPGGPMAFTGDVAITGVVVELDGSPGTTCTVPNTVFTGLSLGWLPG